MHRAAKQPKVEIAKSTRAMRVPRKKLKALAAFVAEREGVTLGELDLAVVGRREMASLNRRYLGQARPTDVLSFDLSDARSHGLCAQIVVCADVAVAQARARGTGAQRELMLYVVHGLLHLMGYNDTSARGAARMAARQEQLLEAFSKRRM